MICLLFLAVVSSTFSDCRGSVEKGDYLENLVIKSCPYCFQATGIHSKNFTLPDYLYLYEYFLVKELQKADGMETRNGLDIPLHDKNMRHDENCPKQVSCSAQVRFK